MPHTPGPWTTDCGGRGNPPGGFHVTAADGAVICGRPGWSSRAEESDANARLIAAAPELLEACESFARVWEMDIRERTVQMELALTQARAAIARARGEALVP